MEYLDTPYSMERVEPSRYQSITNLLVTGSNKSLSRFGKKTPPMQGGATQKLSAAGSPIRLVGLLPDPSGGQRRW
jgi:hypothetical protein